ncbi:hypothetical protein F5X98DRAFT_389696 [Xylaria grammica]|nr:hypothetical protein F5X98DRAFT_389696 [Xylaria grammica]
MNTTEANYAGIVGVFNDNFSLWRAELLKSNISGISDAAGTLRPHGNQHIDLPFPRGAADTKSPDGGVKHNCSLKCYKPAVVLEVGWTSSREFLEDRAKDYIVRSAGKIRTVIAVYMGEMARAERKNERRLRRRYRAGQVDESGQYSYPHDGENVTGAASILVWRGKIINNKVTIERVYEEKFRDATGNAVQSALHLSLEDCVCGIIIDAVKEFKSPLLEIPSEAFCDAIRMDLEEYREERARAIRQEVEEEKRKEVNEENDGKQREEGG